MSAKTDHHIVHPETLTRYPEFMVDLFTKSDADQKRVAKALRKTFKMRAVDTETVKVQAEDLTLTVAKEKLPFVGEFATYLQKV